MRNGFSLIELLCVLSLIGLLSMFAYPNYTKHLAHARRIDGQTALLDLATRLEQYHTQTGNYQTATLATGKKTDVLSLSTSAAGQYQLKIVQATEDYYALEATPIGVQPNKQQARLTLDSHGKEGAY